MLIGIDLGTTNSLAAVWKDGTPQLIPNVHGDVLTPSVVALDDDGEILVGRPAREWLQTHPGSGAAAFKRYMGTHRVIEIGGRRFRAEELSSFVLRNLKMDAEAALGREVQDVIITVPAYFNDAQRKATRIAGELAGLNVVRLVNEPTAAALAYGLHGLGEEKTFLVFNLGGGTFDVSILEMFEGVMEVRATAGDNFLGGEDFLDALVALFMQEVGSPAGMPAKEEDARFHARLRARLERAKRDLSAAEAVEITVPWEGREFAWRVTQEAFAWACEPILRRIRTPLERALRDARIRAADLDQIVLVGGASRMPMVRKLVARLFGRLPAGHLDPDQVVALGAAVQAGLAMRDAALSEVVMTDVAPYTMGIEVSRRNAAGGYSAGHYLPVIERNTVVPCSREQTVSTLSDNQTQVEVMIYQGEARLVKDNVFLGKVSLSVPPRPAGEIAVVVRFSYDASGLLEVDVHVPDTGERRSLVIEENPGVLTREEVAQRLSDLARLKIHPRETAETKALLARAEKVFEATLGEVRERVANEIERFLEVVDRQDPREVAEYGRHLARVLDGIEGTPYL